jgi:transcriptional regulator with XRE-family HTH domain
MRVSSAASTLPFEAEDALRALAARIRTVRKARGLTQPDVAAKAGISANTLLSMEKGAPQVQLGYWLQVLYALDMLEGFAEAVAALGKAQSDVDILESQLPQRVRGKRQR